METENKQFDFSNRLFTAVSILITCVAVFLALFLVYKFKAVDQQNVNQFTVSGEGRVYATPDIAVITLGVETKGNLVEDITNKNVSSMNSIIEKIKALGVEAKDIQTTQYSVTPQYNWTEKEGRIPNGYIISQNIEVKIRDFSKISSVLGVATTGGANVISGLQFTVDDREKFVSEAREKAIVVAKEKALSIAGQAGVRLGRIINIYENSNNYAPYANAKTSVMGLGGAVDSYEVATIQSGEQEISVIVNLTYKIK